MTQTVSVPSTTLELRTAYGPVYRDLLTTPVRDATNEEIPVIDVSDINGDFDARKKLASTIAHAAETSGFFYIKNHGISEHVIEGALNAAQSFFTQTEDQKQMASRKKGKFFNGYSAKSTASASPTEGCNNCSADTWDCSFTPLTSPVDYRESFMWLYKPEYDPEHKDPEKVPAAVKRWIRGEDFIWKGTAHLPDFNYRCLTYWQECLKLSRRLVRIFALALDLPENYFDNVTTYPGSDGVFNYYPALTAEQVTESDDIGLGSHTDLQCFTLLWQDQIGGLQVLTKEGQWLRAKPIPGTFVVNIGDFLMRLTNDRFKSTVHRVYNRSTVDRYSMPFFFGFNFNEECGVLPNCVDEQHPAKYEPISCGEWCQLRFGQGNIDLPA